MAQNTKIKGYNEYGGKIIKEKSTYNLPFKIFINNKEHLQNNEGVLALGDNYGNKMF